MVVVMIVRNGARLIGLKGKGASAKGGSWKARCFMLTPVCWREHVGDDKGVWFAMARARRPTRKANA